MKSFKECEGTDFMQPIKKIRRRTAKIIAAIIFLLVIFMIGGNNHKKRVQEKNSVDNALNHQMILLNQVIRDANIKSNYMNGEESNEMLLKMQQISLMMEKNKENLNEQFLNLNQGYIIDDHQKISIQSTFKQNQQEFIEFSLLWSGFTEKLDYVIMANEKNVLFQQAIDTINSNQTEIEASYVNLSHLISKDKQLSISDFEFYSYMFIIVVILGIIMYVHRFYVSVFFPFKKVVEGLSNRGLLSQANPKKEIENLQVLIESGFNKLDLLLNLFAHMNDNFTFEDNLKYIFNSFKAFIPYNHIGIALLVENDEYLELRYAISDDSLKDMPKQIIGIRSEYQNSTLNKIVQTKEIRIIDDLEEFAKGVNQRPYNKILLSNGIRSSLAMPLIANDRPIGIIFFSSTKPYAYQKEHIDFLTTLGNTISMSFYQKIYVDDVLFSGIRAIAKLAEARDTETGNHLQRMQRYSGFIAEKLFKEGTYQDYITPTYIRDLKFFAPLHDIGKVGISDELLLFKGRYSAEQKEKMKAHVEFGAAVLHQAAFSMEVHGKRELFDMPIHIVKYHHEKWDGSGYPEGLKGEEIPLSARIISIADVLDALLSKRVYKDAISFDETINLLDSLSGTEFDPNIMAVVIKSKDELLKLYLELIEEDKS